MSTNSPEEAHEEAEVPPAKQLEDSSPEEDASKEPEHHSSADSN